MQPSRYQVVRQPSANTSRLPEGGEHSDRIAVDVTHQRVAGYRFAAAGARVALRTSLPGPGDDIRGQRAG